MKRLRISGKKGIIGILLAVVFVVCLFPISALAAPRGDYPIPGGDKRVILAAPVISKVYDGTPLALDAQYEGTAEAEDITQYRFLRLPNSIVSYKVTTNPRHPSVTEPGTVTIEEPWGAGKFFETYELYDANGKNLVTTGTVTAQLYQEGSLTVTERKVTVTADTMSMTAGGEEPVFAATVTGDGFLPGDEPAYTYTVAGDTNVPGTYQIFVSAEYPDKYYDVEFAAGTLTVEAPVTPPTEPTNPIIPVDPNTPPAEPTDPVDPTDPAVPTEPTDPNESPDTTNPTDDTTEPTEPIAPPTEPAPVLPPAPAPFVPGLPVGNEPEAVNIIGNNNTGNTADDVIDVPSYYDVTDIPLAALDADVIAETELTNLSDAEEVFFEDEDVPLADIEDIIFEDEEVPLSSGEEVILLNPDTPLSELPQTGFEDFPMYILGIWGFALAGFGAFRLKARKNED